MPKSSHDHANLGGSNRMLSMVEAAEYIGSTPGSLRGNYVRWKIPVVRGPGRKVQFRQRSLDAWITRHEQDAS